MDRTLDWRPKWDERSNLWTVDLMDCYQNPRVREHVHWEHEVRLDQGREGACTGFGCAHVLAANPRARAMDTVIARALYYEARRQDEWPGESYEGSSVNGVMRAARLMGYIKEWRWITNVAEARHALSWHGPGEAGTWWYSGMWNTDSNGFIHPTGEKVGGHAYKVTGYEVINGVRAYKIDNSWGREWGVNGQALMWEPDFMALLHDQGEFAVPLKMK